jgi:hypothetical protein
VRRATLDESLALDSPSTGTSNALNDETNANKEYGQYQSILVLKDEQTAQEFRAASIHLLGQLMHLSEFHGGVDLQGNPNTTADRKSSVPSLPPRRGLPVSSEMRLALKGEPLARIARLPKWT